MAALRYCLLALALLAPGLAAAEQVVLQLRWDHQFQFAGFYAAQWQGYYAEAGLEVEIRSALAAGHSQLNAIEEVAAGRADFGIGGADILVARDRGQPLVVLASLFQQSPVRWYALPTTALDSPADLVGKRVMRHANDMIDVELQALLRSEGLNLGQINSVLLPANSNYWQALLDKTVDVVPGYTISAPYFAAQANLIFKELRPTSYGVDFYGDSLFTHHRLLERDPELAERFTAASLRGWQYALEHPDAIADRIASELPRTVPVADPVAYNRFQAYKVSELMLYPTLQPGHSNPGRWQAMHDFLRKTGVVNGALDVDELVYDPLLRAQQVQARLLRLLLLSFAAVLVIGVLAWIVTLHRILRRRTQALRQRSAQLEAVIRCMGDGLVIQAADGRLLAINPAAIRMEGFSNATQAQAFFERIGQDSTGPVTLLTTAGQPLPFAEWPLARARRREPFQGLEVAVHNHTTGHRWTGRFSGVPVSDARGDTGLFVITMQDISEHKQAEAALEAARRAADAANRAKSEFLANMSHEIRTPMTAILGYADVLLARNRDPEDQQNIETIKRNGEHLLDIINDILDLSRIEAGKLDVVHRSFALTQLLADIQALMQLRAAEKHLAFTIECPQPLPERVISDPTRLKQILVNLVGNAIKFTTTGSVRLRVQLLDVDTNPRLQFDIIDTGIGMSPAQQARLFQPFSQVDASLTRRAAGTGLGLAICRRLVALLGGEINVTTELGRGSTFSFYMPISVLAGAVLRIPTFAMSAASNTTALLPSLQGRVLVVDDQVEIRQLVQRYLRETGLSITTADNGREALVAVAAAEAAQQPFSALVIDMQMPVLDGYATTHHLREAGFRQPIIALTAAAMQGDRERCLEAGCDDYVSKPIERHILLERLARHLLPLPSTPAPAPAAAAEQAADEKRVLVVDDNRDAGESTAILLGMLGYVTRTAQDGRASIALARSWQPAIVLLDLGLPDMSGFEAVTQMRALPELHDTVFIALSGRDGVEDRRQAQQVGFAHYLVKPASLETLQTLFPARRGAARPSPHIDRKA